MPSLWSSAAVLTALLGAVSGLSIPRDADSYGRSKAYLYFQQNDPSGASIVALDASNQGKGAVVTPTGGKGLQFINAAGQPATNDSLNSQGPVIVGGNLLFSVNSGSNTVSMFKINPSDPLHPQLVGKPTDTQGDFPVSVAYSTALQQACVLNGGTRNSVACYKVDANKGLTPDGPVRPLNKTLKTPPVGGSGLVSNVIFSPDSSFLLADAKGPNGAPGAYYAWPVNNGRVSQQAVVTRIPDMFNVFGMSFQGNSNSKLFVADVAFGGSIVTIGKDLKVTEGLHQNESPTILQACWSTWNPATQRFYSSDAAYPHFGTYNPDSGVFEGLLNVDQGFKGTFDTLVDPRDSRTMYYLSGTNAIAAVDPVKKVGAGTLTVSGKGVGSRQYWAGLAIYVPN